VALQLWEVAAEPDAMVEAVVVGESATKSGPPGKSGWAIDSRPVGSRRSQPAAGEKAEQAGLQLAFEEAPEVAGGERLDVVDAGRRARRQAMWVVRRACGWANADREIPPVVQEVFQVEARAERPSYWPARIEMSSRESTYQPFHVVTYGEEPCKKLQINLRMELLQITYK